MVALIGTEIGMETLVEDFLKVEIEGYAACRVALPYLADPDERERVLHLGRVHQRHAGLLRGLAESYGVTTTVDGTAFEASTLGRIRLANSDGGDGAVLEALGESEAAAIRAYERALRSTTLAERTRPLFENALDDLRSERASLEEAARLAVN